MLVSVLAVLVAYKHAVIKYINVAGTSVTLIWPVRELVESTASASGKRPHTGCERENLNALYLLRIKIWNFFIFLAPKFSCPRTSAMEKSACPLAKSPESESRA